MQLVWKCHWQIKKVIFLDKYLNFTFIKFLFNLKPSTLQVVPEGVLVHISVYINANIWHTIINVIIPLLISLFIDLLAIAKKDTAALYWL